MESLAIFFSELAIVFESLNAPENAFLAYIALLGGCMIVAVARIGLFLTFQGYRALIWKNTRAPAKSKNALVEASASLLAGVAGEYITMCENGITTANVRDITETHVGKLGALGWSFSSMLSLVESLDRAIVPVGVVLAVVFEETRAAFGLSAVALWLVVKIICAFFDAKISRERLCSEVYSYVAREGAKFFTPDTTASLANLQTTMSDAISTQSDALATSSRALGDTVSATIGKSLGEMTRAIEHTLIKLADADTMLKEPLSHWNAQILEAARLQQTANTSNEKLLEVMVKFSEISGTLATMLTELERHSPEKVVLGYKVALETMTTKLGDGFGAMLDQHIARSLKELTGKLEHSTAQMTSANLEMGEAMRQIVTRLDEIGRNEVKAISAVRQQIDIRLDELTKIDNTSK